MIYVRLVARLLEAGIRPHYAVHITGHGWRKLMRLEQPFVYRVTTVRPAGSLFDFICQRGPVGLEEAYATFNMGAGFALYLSEADTDAA